MSTQAEVKSIDTIAFVKAAMAAFAHDGGQAVGEVELQAQRMAAWICDDQAAYWKTEIRRAADAVNRAMIELQNCRTYKKVGDHEPACMEEKKALEKAKRRLARAEQKAEAVRRWTPVVRQQMQETRVRLTRFREVIDIDCPKALARLERMLVALDNYTHTTAPRGATGGPATEGSVARPLDDGAAAGPSAPAAAGPPAEAPPAPGAGSGS
jgi:hypothetical protein